VAVTTRVGANELAAPLDLLLTSSAVGMADRLMPNVAWSRFVLNLARQPRTVASRVTSLGRESPSIAEGRSQLAPAKGDKRFADPAWRGNALLHHTMQAFPATNDTVNQLYSDADLDWRDAERIRFVSNLLTEALAPSNNPVLNPLGWKALIDTGGPSAVRGLRHFVDDIAVTPGSVTFRCEEFELIQYRPTDLVWRYWVNNYVEGKSPAAFDVLYWNADTTRMAAALHRDMVMTGVNNSLVTPGVASMLGRPVDLNQLTTDASVVAGIADHTSPWQACYRSARLLRIENMRFVLSSSGHIASLVNPPGNPRASYRLGNVDEQDPAFWVESAERHTDSWWPDFVAWLGERSGEKKTAPAALGGAGMAPLEPAPGFYVLER
jgi:poly(3-hydroxyalkanoate) synthetase